MAISIEKIRGELRAAWRRKMGFVCDSSSRLVTTEGPYILGAACDMTGASFVCLPNAYPESACYPVDHQGCAEALIAQWEGLAPVVKMPKTKKPKGKKASTR